MTLFPFDFYFTAMEERDQQRKERRALIEAEKQRKEEARLVSCLFFDGLFLVFFFYLVINWVDSLILKFLKLSLIIFSHMIKHTTVQK